MAKFYGKSSSCLVKNDIKYFSFAAGLAVAVLLLVWLVVKSAPPAAAGFAALALIIFIVIVADPFILFFKRKSLQFYRGLSGEQDIKKDLENLPNDFSVYQGLEIGDRKGDIDFVVLGPTGIFLLEVKSHKGDIGFNGSQLTLNGRNFTDKNFFRQVHGETWALKNYLKQQTGKEFFINSVLVFSSPYAHMHFGYTEVLGINIIQKDYLIGLFYRFPKFDYNGSTASLHQALLRAVS